MNFRRLNIFSHGKFGLKHNHKGTRFMLWTERLDVNKKSYPMETNVNNELLAHPLIYGSSERDKNGPTRHIETRKLRQESRSCEP